MNNIIHQNEISELINKLHKSNKKIVLVGGCFDILHYGHILLLEKARKQGDCLIVLLENDKRIQELKGANRPLHTQLKRAKMLTSLRFVDFVILLSDFVTNEDYDNLVKRLQPAIIATTKGSASLKFILKQAKKNKSKIFLVELVPNLSTSRILEVLKKEL